MKEKVESSSHVRSEAVEASDSRPQNNEHTRRGARVNDSLGRVQPTSPRDVPDAHSASATSGGHHPQRDKNIGRTSSSAPHEQEKRKVLTPRMVAVLLGFDEKTIERWARNGYLPAHPVGEGKKTYWRFFEDELIDWLKSRTNGARAA